MSSQTLCAGSSRRRSVSLCHVSWNIFPINTASRTWICEDHWRILGFAQVRERPSRVTWDLAYLASMVNGNVSSDEVLTALLDYMLQPASTHALLRIFPRVHAEIPEH